MTALNCPQCGCPWIFGSNQKYWERLYFKIIPQTENLYFAQKNLTSYHQMTFPKSLNRISLELASSIGSYVMSKSESRRR